jgi:hypothetical protein
MIMTRFTTESSVESFIESLDEVPTQDLIHSHYVKSCLTKDGFRSRNPLGVAEALLVLFTQREEYEMCSMIVKSYPELVSDQTLD